MAKKPKHHEPTNGQYIDLKLVKTLAEAGWTNKEMSDALGISTRTFLRKQAADPDFKAAVKDWKKASNERVERSLYETACGFEYVEVKEIIDATGAVTETTKTTKLQPPNTTAMVYWLKNRMPEQYRDRREMEIDITPNSPVLVVPAGVSLEVWEDGQES